MHVTVDYLVKNQECAVKPVVAEYNDVNEIIDFRLEANVNTYAAFLNETDSTRLDSHDYRYEKGAYVYHDTYVGREQFVGQEALRKADHSMPYRGLEYYQDGEFLYKCKVTGDVPWFQGYEEIYLRDERVYECYFHGGLLR